MSRNTENIPQSSLQQHGASNPVALNIPSGDEFFTDSILDDSSVSSRIPSPKKALFGRPRRAIAATKVVARNLADASNRSSRPSSSLSSAQNKRLQHLPVLTKPKARSPTRTNDLTTPPQSHDGPPLLSPFSDRSSPPRDLTESYQRIADEEDLADTEGVLEDSDDEYAEEEDAIGGLQETLTNDQLSPVRELARSSVATTPTQNHLEWNKENFVDDRVESMSEASGLSFLQQMTDQNLAAKLTPGFLNLHKDKQNLKRALFSEQPIVFNKTGRPFQDTPYLDRVSDENVPPSKVRAFSLANGFDPKRRSMAPAADADTHASEQGADRWPKAFALAGEFKNFGDGQRRPAQKTPPAPRLKAFSLAGEWKDPRALSQQIEPETLANGSVGIQGGREEHPALTAENLERKDKQNSMSRLHDLSGESVTTAHSEPLPKESRQFKGAELIAKSFFQAARGRARTKLGMVPLSPHLETSAPASPVDWIEAAANVPLPSIEDSSTPRVQVRDEAPTSAEKTDSLAKLRRWDADLTGASFQVSQSPPVRNKNVSVDNTLDKEIEVLTRQAITRNRLGQLKERESIEHLKRTSRSPSSTSGKQNTHENEEQFDQEKEIAPRHEREQIPETPSVAHRPSGDVQGQRNFEGSDKQHSLSALQRLARMSITPRSSPLPELHVKHQNPVQILEASPIQRRESVLSELSAPATEKAEDKVAQTPRVTGSWTDTVLPDTIKTTKLEGNRQKYAQTPHVSAGGWINTPLAHGVAGRQSSSQAPEVIEEVTEELTNIINGIDDMQAELREDMVKKDGRHTLPKSALTNILDHAKSKQARVISQDITDLVPSHQEEVTNLNLGDTTIQSLEGLLDLDVNDMSTILRLGAEDRPLDLTGIPQSEAEAAMLERLGTKLDRLRHNIHDARKGISKLEHEVAKPTKKPMLGIEYTESCPTCGSDSVAEHSHTRVRMHKTTIFGAQLPYMSLLLSVPIPVLFHARKGSQLLPRPTLLGYLVLAFYVWYLLECSFCEMYCHPTYAVQYSWPKEPEPIFPWVLPTMLTRWLRDFGLTGVTMSAWKLVVAIGRMAGMLTGWTDGFVDSNNTQSAGPADIVKAFAEGLSTSSATGLGGDGWSMMNDEML